MSTLEEEDMKDKFQPDYYSNKPSLIDFRESEGYDEAEKKLIRTIAEVYDVTETFAAKSLTIGDIEYHERWRGYIQREYWFCPDDAQLLAMADGVTRIMGYLFKKQKRHDINLEHERKQQWYRLKKKYANLAVYLAKVSDRMKYSRHNLRGVPKKEKRITPWDAGEEETGE